DHHSAVFWTRVTPADPSAGDIPVVLEVAKDAEFTDMVRRTADLTARAERDFTVKHDLHGRGLEPGHEYFYRFIARGVTSPVGRVRTLPLGATPQVNLAVVSCQLYPGGLFNAYEAISQLDRLDAVVHLGDYIYEYGAAPNDYGMNTGAPLGRSPLPPHEIVSLADYRTRHAQYKTDPDLQAAHAAPPSSASGTTTRSPTTPGCEAPRTISPRPKATSPHARRRLYGPISNGCRSARPRPAP
ncbi:alkaline phosphatase family protein, partial [Streptomyces coelicoflavus ZG0656]